MLKISANFLNIFWSMVCLTFTYNVECERWSWQLEYEVKLKGRSGWGDLTYEVLMNVTIMWHSVGGRQRLENESKLKNVMTQLWTMNMWVNQQTHWWIKQCVWILHFFHEQLQWWWCELNCPTVINFKFVPSEFLFVCPQYVHVCVCQIWLLEWKQRVLL